MTEQTQQQRRRTTGIEWTEHTWNPFVGCSIHTPGCTNCYAMRQAARIVAMSTTRTYDGTVREVKGNPVWTGKINRASAATMKRPFQIREPSIIFVNSMSDFFHENAEDSWRIDALGVMAATHHQYQVLTKRPEHIVPFLERHDLHFPDNVWIGATVERGDFRHRIDTLRKVPARIRFLSIEPIIGELGKLDLDGIQWVIGGGESGIGARLMNPDWARQIRDECVRQSVPFFWKQWGQPRNNPIYHEAPTADCPLVRGARVEYFDPVGKGGSLIDGREWKEYPDLQLQRSLI
jgi:protein gp37